MYVPTFVSEIGVGALLPLFALTALDLGEPAAVASLAVAVYAAGRMLGAAWGGRLAARTSGSLAALAAYVVLTAGSLLAAFATNVAVFEAAVVIIGAGHGAVHVARQAQLVDAVSPAVRARRLSNLAGIWRIGNFVGPFAGAAVIAIWGLSSAYLFASVTMVLGALVLAAAVGFRRPADAPSVTHLTLRRVVWDHRSVFATLGLGVALMGAVRQARVLVIPLWGEHIGMSDSTISLVFGLATAADMVLFIPAGYVMDRLGRVWTAVPSAMLLGLGAVALPFSHETWQVTLAAMLLGLGNGWGSGILMTLGADAAPQNSRPVFLAAWTILQDLGGLLGPALAAGATALSFVAGFFTVGALGFASAAAMFKWVPRGRAGESAPTRS